MSRKLINPFNEKVRERIFGFSSSGSEESNLSSSSSSSSTYSAASPNLSFLVQSFLEEGESDQTNEAMESIESEDDDPSALIRDVVNPIVRSSSNKDRFRADLVAHVTQAAGIFSILKQDPTVLNRNVMNYLREIGYDCGVCKTKWEGVPGGSLIGGSYEFIDIVCGGSQNGLQKWTRGSLPVVRDENSKSCRYVVDLNFGAQFEVARESERYRSVVGALPSIFVGKCEDLRRIVRVMAEELRKTMKVSGMSLPPWRKNRYLQAKWFGPYRRNVSQLQSSGGVASVVKCRSVGFFASDVGVAPVSGRTRYIA